MASSFIGLTVLVKLHPGPVLQGLVADVVQQNLVLRNGLRAGSYGSSLRSSARLINASVTFLETGQQVPEYTVSGSQIADLEVASSVAATIPPRVENTQAPSLGRASSKDFEIPAPPSRTLSYPRPPLSLTPSSVPPPPKPADLVDPAILSFTRSPAASHAVKVAQQYPPVTGPSRTYAQVAEESSNIKRTQLELKEGIISPAPVSATLTAPFAGLSNDLDGISGSDARGTTVPPISYIQSTGSAAISKSKTKKNEKQPSRKPLAVSTNGAVSPPSSPETSRRVTAISRAVRSQQIAALHTQPARPATETHKMQKRRKRRQRASEPTHSGWGTEDATDIQDMAEFDFVGNLSHFDKQTVFNQLRTEDTTADADRLVSFNRATGMTKLRPTENVLEAPRAHRRMSSMSSKDDGDDVVRAGKVSVAATSMLRGLSQLSLSVPMRKNSSNTVEAKSPVDILGGTGSLHRALSRPKYSSSITMSPRVSSTSLERKRKTVLRFAESERICSVCTPQSILAVQTVAEEEFNITEDLIAEQAARSIADIALSAINPGGRRLAQNNHNPSPVIVLLVASNKWGSRAIAAARLLLDRGARVIVSCLGMKPYESESYTHDTEWDLHFVTQLKRLEAMDEAIYSWADTSSYLKTLDAPPELIIDCLIGPHCTLDTISDPEHCLTDMIAWANASKASVLAVDIPSGIHGNTGQVEMREGEPAEVRARVVACLGAPTMGLLKALEMRSLAGEGGEWKIFVCDVGLNPAWRALRARKGTTAAAKPLKFGGEWIAEVWFEEDEVE